jgi:hypothetical protein
MCTHAVLGGGGPGGSLSVAFSCNILAVSSLVILAMAADSCDKAEVTVLVFLLWRLLVAAAGVWRLHPLFGAGFCYVILPCYSALAL